MRCLYCGQEKVKHDSCASCMYSSDRRGCGAAMCTDDCARDDGQFHGGRCGCGCQMMICQAHWESHAREVHADNGGSPSCFPRGSKPLAASGLATAATMLVAHSTGNRAEPTQRQALNRFLNIVAPGHRAFLKFIDRLPEELVTVDRTVWESIGEARIEFDAAFFNEGTVERCIRITAQALGRANRLDPEGVHKQIAIRSRPREGFLHSLAEIEAWAHGEIPDMTDQALRTWIPERASRSAVKRLAHALSYPAPATVDGIAEWLLDAHEGAVLRLI